MAGRWDRGAAIILREVWDGRVWSAWPSVVVRDDDKLLSVYIPAGTTIRYAVDAAGRELRIYAPAPWAFADRVTTRPVLSLTRPGTEHAKLLFWNADWAFLGWYINLERALGRTAKTHDFVDHCLDVLVPPDRSRWTWKDEDELDEAVARGIFSPDDAARFRREGERAAREILEGEPTADRDWTAWRPDPAWTTPALFEGWDDPPARP